MSAPALAVAFFDPERRLYGTARSGATLLFDDSRATAVPEGPRLRRNGERVLAELEGRVSVDLEPAAPAVDLGGATATLCRARGKALGRRVEGLGTLGETSEAPNWEELDAVRAISVLVDTETALLALSRRPAGALGHGDELPVAFLVQGGEPVAVEEARFSTVYDGDGRQRSAGLELWLPGEEFPRRGSGVAVAGSSLELGGLRVHAAVFRWRLEGREATGAYELTVREPAPEAA